MKYKCTICGYIYDPEKGDEKQSVPKGTSFDELSNDWVCPLCGAEKSFFEQTD